MRPESQVSKPLSEEWLRAKACGSDIRLGTTDRHKSSQHGRPIDDIGSGKYTSSPKLQILQAPTITATDPSDAEYAAEKARLVLTLRYTLSIRDMLAA